MTWLKEMLEKYVSGVLLYRSIRYLISFTISSKDLGTSLTPYR